MYLTLNPPLPTPTIEASARATLSAALADGSASLPVDSGIHALPGLQAQIDLATLPDSVWMGAEAVQHRMAELYALLQGLGRGDIPSPPTEPPAAAPSPPPLTLIGIVDIQHAIDAICAKF